MRIPWFPGIALYIGVGAFLHWCLIGPNIAWDSALTWALFLAWPIILIALCVAAFTTFMAIALLFIVINDWHEQRKRVKYMARMQEQHVAAMQRRSKK